MTARDDFFQSYGTLSSDAPSYIERPADKDLVHALEKGDLCLVLAPRQTGKSSLMIHARRWLKELQIDSAFIDLQNLKNHQNIDIWFGGVVYQIQRSCDLQCDTLAWWEEHRRIGPTQRFMTFIEDIVLQEKKERVVLFFDEVDSVLPLPFSDDFFTTVRALFNARANNETLRRLGIVLLGVATPADFVKDRSRTPFNIGVQIALEDFDPDSCAPFLKVLGDQSKAAVDRIFYWCSGQPLMVQRISKEVFKAEKNKRTPALVDDIVTKEFINQKIEKESHFKFIRDYLIENMKYRRNTLKTYAQVLRECEIEYKEQSPVQERLRLSGVVREKEGKLTVRNRIYEKVFNAQWVKENTPKDTMKIVTSTSSAITVIVLLWFFLLQPLFFSNSPDSYPVKNIYYTTESNVKISFLKPEKDIRRITIDGEKITEIKDMDKAGDIDIPFNNVPVGGKKYIIRFYGVRNSYQKSVVVAYFPKERWKKPEIELVPVPAGCFYMGYLKGGDIDSSDEKPPHRVCLDSFAIGKYEVTQKQWEQLMGYNPSYFKKGDDYPVENVSWFDAREFLQRLSLESDQKYRLPTEAEWEYAARGDTITKYYWGDEMNGDYAWYYSNSGEKTYPVGRKMPNKYGLYDMLGNVYEWCNDWYLKDYYKQSIVKNPKGPESAEYRVIRGGSWIVSDTDLLRCAHRFWIDPNFRDFDVGFRCAR